MFKDDFSQRSSALILISLVVLSLVSAYFNKGEDKKQNNIMIFPAYRMEETTEKGKDINSAMPFAIKVDYNTRWTLSTENNGGQWPQAEIYTPYYIYDGEKPVAVACFNTFSGKIEAIDNRESYKTALEPLLTDSKTVWDGYIPVLNGFNNQVCIMSVTEGDITYPAIVIYDINLNSYFSIVFMPGLMTDTEIHELAKTVRIVGQ